MKRNPLKELAELGQSVWLDYIHRDLLTSGRLRQLIEDDGVRGLTSNPAIFQKAIAQGGAYDEDVRRLALDGRDAAAIADALTIADVRAAADEFRPVWEQTGGWDGFVSLEVNPHLARDTEASVAEARRLWESVARPNVMIKIPGTAEGLPAIHRCLAEGININVTLLFGLARYREVTETWLAAMEERLARGQPVKTVHSVASFFLSRIDVLLDPKLEELAARGGPTGAAARELRGQAAIANAKGAWRLWHEVVGSPRFLPLADAGAAPQRVLWASTGTKDPHYSDVKYVEALIGPQTVNTMPVETLDAYRDHGDPQPRLSEGLDDAERVLSRLAELGLDVAQAATQLEEEGVAKFAKPYDQLVETLEEARRAALG